MYNPRDPNAQIDWRIRSMSSDVDRLRLQITNLNNVVNNLSNKLNSITSFKIFDTQGNTLLSKDPNQITAKTSIGDIKLDELFSLVINDDGYTLKIKGQHTQIYSIWTESLLNRFMIDWTPPIMAEPHQPDDNKTMSPSVIEQMESLLERSRGKERYKVDNVVINTNSGAISIKRYIKDVNEPYTLNRTDLCSLEIIKSNIINIKRSGVVRELPDPMEIHVIPLEIRNRIIDVIKMIKI
jgi:hypothetical protein